MCLREFEGIHLTSSCCAWEISSTLQPKLAQDTFLDLPHLGSFKAVLGRFRILCVEGATLYFPTSSVTSGMVSSFTPGRFGSR